MEYYKDTNGDVWCYSKLGITAKVFTLDHIDAECKKIKLAGLTMPNGVHYRDLPIKEAK